MLFVSVLYLALCGYKERNDMSPMDVFDGSHF